MALLQRVGDLGRGKVEGALPGSGPPGRLWPGQGPGSSWQGDGEVAPLRAGLPVQGKVSLEELLEWVPLALDQN